MWLLGWIARIVAAALGVRLVNAFLDVFGLDPMRWLVALLMEVPTEGWIEVGRWALAFFVALVIWSFVYLWQWKRRAALEPPASVSLPELDPSNAGFIDEDSVKLAGIVNALMERALRHGFSLPLPAGDLFLQRYRTLENSEHPIWTDKAINQIRRDFLHHAGMVGSSEKFGMNLLEWQDERQQATLFGRRLIEKLTGVKNPDDEIFVSLTWPDKKWDRRDTYTLGDAAYLWFDLEPPQDGQQMPEDVRALYQEWRKQIYDEKMDLPLSDTVEQAMTIALEKTNIEDQKTVTPDTKVRIAELEKVAEKEGVKPIFLFPYRRGE